MNKITNGLENVCPFKCSQKFLFNMWLWFLDFQWFQLKRSSKLFTIKCWVIKSEVHLSSKKHNSNVVIDVICQNCIKMFNFFFDSIHKWFLIVLGGQIIIAPFTLCCLCGNICKSIFANTIQYIYMWYKMFGFR